MAGYVIADVDVHDPEGYEEYRRLVPATLERYGGRFLIRGGKTEQLEGDWQPKRLVVLEFPSAEQARRWWESEEYREAKELRQRLATSSLLLVEGAS
jgi:uncharacterized protein (DUF1330 family)